jgi:FMN phosphatase YigB (HAD superfamily)
MLEALPFDALVFDVGGVIVSHDNELLFRRLAQHSAAPDAIDRIRAECADSRYNTGALTIEALYARLARDIGYRLSWDGFVSDWCCHFEFDHDMLALCQRLATSNRVILFSNTNPIHWKHLKELGNGALGRFETYLSYEIGLAKPAVEAFRSVAERAGIDPMRSLFIDDLRENVEGARRAGFRAEVFLNKVALERTLRLSDRR